MSSPQAKATGSSAINFRISAIWHWLEEHWWASASLLSIGITLFRFYPFLFNQTIIFGDNHFLMVPGKLFIAEWLVRGIVPLWNPLLFAGLSIIGDINQSLWYISTALFMVFPPGSALSINIVLHQCIAFLGMMFLAKKLTKHIGLQVVATGLWVCSPFVTASLNNISTMQSLAWMPIVVALSVPIGMAKQQVKSVTLLVVVVLLQMLGGYPQHVVYSLLAGVLLNVWIGREYFFRKEFSRLLKWFLSWILVAIASVGITAFLWLPFLEVVNLSTRNIQSAEQASAGALSLSELVKVSLPTLFDNAHLGMKWGPSWSKPPNALLYIPFLALVSLFVVLKRRLWRANDWFFLAVVMVPLVIAIVSTSPAMNVIQQLPILSMTRGVSTILMISSLFSALWIATLFERVSLSHARSVLAVTGGLLVISVALLYVTTNTSYFTSIWNGLDGLVRGRISNSSFHTLERDQLIAFNFFLFSLIQLIFFGIGYYLLSKKHFLALGIAVSIEAMTLSLPLFLFAPASLYQVSANSETVVPIFSSADLTQYRLLPRNYNAPFTDFGYYYDSLVLRQPFSNSYVDSVELANFTHLRRMRNGATPDWNMALGVPIITGYTTLIPESSNAIFNETDVPGLNNLPEISTENEALRQWATKYYLVDSWFDLSAEVLPSSKIGENGYWQLYEIPGALPRFRFENDAPVEFKEFTENPNELDLTFSNENGQQFLIIADRFDTNWKVKVNGVEGQVENWQGMRRVAIPQGEVSVQMWFYPK